MMPEAAPFTHFPDGRTLTDSDAWWIAPDYRLTDRGGVPTIEPTEPFGSHHGDASWRLARPADLPGAPNFFAGLANVAVRPGKAPGRNAFASGLLGLGELSHQRTEGLGALLEEAGEAARLLGPTTPTWAACANTGTRAPGPCPSGRSPGSSAGAPTETRSPHPRSAGARKGEAVRRP